MFFSSKKEKDIVSSTIPYWEEFRKFSEEEGTNSSIYLRNDKLVPLVRKTVNKIHFFFLSENISVHFLRKEDLVPLLRKKKKKKFFLVNEKTLFLSLRNKKLFHFFMERAENYYVPSSMRTLFLFSKNMRDISYTSWTRRTLLRILSLRKQKVISDFWENENPEERDFTAKALTSHRLSSTKLTQVRFEHSNLFSRQVQT